MRKPNTRKNTAALGALTATIVAAVLVIIALQLVQLQPTHEAVKRKLEAVTTLDLDFKQLRLHLWPRPHLDLHDVQFQDDGGMRGVIRTLVITPQLLPLLTGRIRLHRFLLDQPRVSLEFKRPDEEALPSSQHGVSLPLPPSRFRPQDLMPLIPPGNSALWSILPGTFEIEHGKLQVQVGKHPPVSVERLRLKARHQDQQLQLELAGASDLWHMLTLTATFRHAQTQGSGNLKIKRLRLAPLQALGGWLAGFNFEDTLIDLESDFHLKGPDQLALDFRSYISSLVLSRQERRLSFGAIEAQGNLALTPGSLLLEIARMNLLEPQLRLSGQWRYQPQTVGHMLQLGGKGLAVEPIRTAVLKLAEDLQVVQTLFEVVRAGTLSNLSVSVQGQSAADFGHARNWRVVGQIDQGTVMVPTPTLLLEAVRGQVVYANGILEGEQLEARMGPTTGSDGRLRLGFEGKGAPFLLDIQIQADLAQLPPILKQLLTDPKVAAELQRIEQIKGQATGRLIIGDRFGQLRTRVQASNVQLQGRYQHIPYPLQLAEGQFLLDDQRIALSNGRGKIGSASFSQFSAQLERGQRWHLSASLGQSTLDLSELLQWLRGYKAIAPRLAAFQKLSGLLKVSSARVAGPLSTPSRWQYAMDGHLVTVALTSKHLPDTIHISKGRVSAQTGKLNWQKARSRLLDAELHLTGSCHWIEGKPFEIILEVDGILEQGAIDWGTKTAGLPPALKPRAPLRLETAHFAYTGLNRYAFSGTMLSPGGTRVALVLDRAEEILAIKRLHIKGATTEAQLGLQRSLSSWRVDFKGSLVRAVLDDLLARNDVLQGGLQGDFQARVARGQQFQATVSGRLAGKDLTIPAVDNPHRFKARRFTLAGEQDHLHIETAEIEMDGQTVSLSGKVMPSQQSWQIDLDAACPRFVIVPAAPVQGVVGAPPKREERGAGLHFLGTPITGRIRFHADHFQIGSYTWKPLQAELDLAESTISAKVLKANLCGIDTPGTLTQYEEGLALSLKPTSQQQDLQTTLSCLKPSQRLVTGRFDLSGQLKGAGPREQLFSTLNGNLTLHAEHGRIYRMNLLSKIFALLNITEVFRGRLPDLIEEGFAFNAIDAQGSVQQGTLILEELIIDGASMELAVQGILDFTQNRCDLTVLVAPFKTIDAVIKYLPIIGYLSGGSIVSIPLKVSGNLQSPDVAPLSPALVQADLLGLMERTLKLPSHLIKLILPEQKADKPSSPPTP